MTTLTEAAAACCACLRVHWVETKHPDGTTSGHWLCTQCGREFAPGSQADAGIFRQLLEVLGREVGKTGESEGAVDVAERVLAERDAARADLATAANVITHLQQENAALLNAFPEYGSTGNELREERERTGKLLNVLHRNGFRECDIAACNCGSWHAGPNLRAEKAEAVQQAQEDRARELIAESEADRAAAEADLATAKATLTEFQRFVDEACSAEVDARVSSEAVRLRLRYMAGLQEAGQMVVLRADYERLVASLPKSGLKVVRTPEEPSDG